MVWNLNHVGNIFCLYKILHCGLAWEAESTICTPAIWLVKKIIVINSKFSNYIEFQTYAEDMTETKPVLNSDTISLHEQWQVKHRWYRYEFLHRTETCLRISCRQLSKSCHIFHLSVGEMSGVGASLAVWSYLPVYSSFYFSISSMNTGASFIRTTNNDAPLTISLSSVSTKSMKSIFSYLKKCWIVLNAWYKQNSIRITGWGFCWCFQIVKASP